MPFGLLNFVICLPSKLSTHHFPGETLQRILQSHPKADVCLRLPCELSSEHLMYLRFQAFPDFINTPTSMIIYVCVRGWRYLKHMYTHTHMERGLEGRGKAPLNQNSCILISFEHFQLVPSREAPLFARWLAFCAPMLVTSPTKFLLVMELN